MRKEGRKEVCTQVSKRVRNQAKIYYLLNLGYNARQNISQKDILWHENEVFTEQ